MLSRPIKSTSRCSLFLVVLAACLNGCGSGTQMAPAPTQTYPFQSASSYTWVQEFAADNLLTTDGPTTFPTEQITGLAADASGNVIAAGYDLGSFAGQPNPGPVAEIFVAKFDTNGKQIWVQQLGTGSGDFLNGVAVDPNGNIFAVGITHGALAGASNPNGLVEGTVYKFNPDGNLLWQRQFTVGDAYYTYPFAIAADAGGSITIGGDYSTPEASASTPLFVERLDGSSGATIWQQTFGASGLDFLDSLASDGRGDIYATVETTGPFPGQATGSPSSSLLKLSGATGEKIWNQTLTEPNLSIVVPFGLAVRSGSIIVGGATSNEKVTIGSSAFPLEAGFLASFSATDGSVQWNKILTTSYGDEITGVAVSTSGNVYAVGETNGLYASGFTQPQNNMMVLKFAADGTNLTAAQFGTGEIVNQDAGIGPVIASSPNGQLYVGGPVQAPFTGFSNPRNELQLFVARFSQ